MIRVLIHVLVFKDLVSLNLSAFKCSGAIEFVSVEEVVVLVLLKRDPTKSQSDPGIGFRHVEVIGKVDDDHEYYYHHHQDHVGQAVPNFEHILDSVAGIVADGGRVIGLSRNYQERLHQINGGDDHVQDQDKEEELHDFFLQ